jgi:hypothetical protein
VDAACSGGAAKLNDFSGEPNLLANQRFQPRNAALLTLIVRRQHLDRRNPMVAWARPSW